jgi:hypothetical protein
VYVDVTKEFAGHGIGSEEPFINAEGIGAYHPNAAGYRAYAKATSPQYGAPGWTRRSRWPNSLGLASESAPNLGCQTRLVCAKRDL